MANNQKETMELTDDILAVTMKIRDRYPELYQHLGETPFLPPANNEGIEPSDLKEYLNTIRSQLKNYKKVQSSISLIRKQFK